MSTKTLPPTYQRRSHSRRGGNILPLPATSPRRSLTKFPSIPRPTLISPDFADLHPQNRINVLHPPSVPRRTVALETGKSHLHLRTRTLDMQRKEAEMKHGEWRKAMYGTPTVRADYKSGIRSTLKGQMEESQQSKRDSFNAQLNYSIHLFERDRQDNLDDSQKRHNKLQFLLTFTRANKQAMEDRMTERRERRMQEARFERELLKFNPINWSHTLK